MITDRQSYRACVKQDLKAYGLERVGIYNYWWMDSLRFQLRLRKIEYLHNTCQHNPVKRLRLMVLEVINHRLAARLGFTIPKNVFGPGAKIFGAVVLGNNVAVGANAVVNKSFGDNVTLAGAPARVLAETGAVEQGVFPASLHPVT